jgi:NCK adaptor protein
MAENVLDIMVALYSFSSQNDQEISFEKGDRLEILDRPRADPEWYRARSAAGQVRKNCCCLHYTVVYSSLFKQQL